MNFSPEYLEKYAKGELSAKEMHSLEKAMQHNPFLAEAMVGITENEQLFVNQPFATQVQALQQQMPYRKAQKTTPLFANLQNYKIAASVALLLVMTALLWFFANPAATKQMAGEAKPIAQAEQAHDMPTPSNATMPSIQEVEKKETEKPVITNKTSANANVNSNAKAKAKAKPNIAILEQAPQAQEPLAEKSEETAIKLARAGSQDAKMQTDDEAEETKQGNEASKRLTTLRSRKENSAKPALADAVADTLTGTGATPNIGWEAYGAYLEQNRKQLKNKTQGTVVLELTIGKDGNILAIAVIKSFSAEAEAEAKRLVRAGSKWGLKSPKSTAKVQVEIKF